MNVLLLHMNWSEFINKLLNQDLRLSSLEVEGKTGIRQPVIDRWKNGEISKPQRNTIRRLEEGLNIKIDDSDPENITYKKLPEEKEFEEIETKIHDYPVLSHVYAGNSPDMFIKENISEYVSLPYKKKDNCFAVRVIGDSMNHKIEEGDIILVDMDAEVTNGSIVIARLKTGKQIIKRYRAVSNQNSMFYSDNGNYEPLVVDMKEIEAIYKVVGIWKAL